VREGSDSAPQGVRDPHLAGSIGLALLALYRDRLVPAPARERMHELAGGGLQVLRRVIGDYVAWMTFGVAALGGLLALTLR